MCFLPASALGGGRTPDGFFGVNPGDLFKLPAGQVGRAPAGDRRRRRPGRAHGRLVVGPRAGPARSTACTTTRGATSTSRSSRSRATTCSGSRCCASARRGARRSRATTARAPDGTANFAAFAAALAKRYGAGRQLLDRAPRAARAPRHGLRGLERGEREGLLASRDARATTPTSTPPTRSAIKSVDANARVVLGGLAGASNGAVIAPDDFLRAMYAHRPDLKGNVDAVGFHPYAQDPQRVYSNDRAPSASALDAIAGPGVPLELTEIGWTTVDVSESQRADYMREVASTLARTDCGIERVSAYAWLGPEQVRERSRAVVRHRHQGRRQQADRGRLRRLGERLERADAGDTVHICSGTAARSATAPRARPPKKAGSPEAARQGPPRTRASAAPDRQDPLLEGLPGRASSCAPRASGQGRRDAPAHLHDARHVAQPHLPHQVRRAAPAACASRSRRSPAPARRPPPHRSPRCPRARRHLRTRQPHRRPAPDLESARGAARW